MEEDKMINVLCIGKYDGEGKFTKNQWKYFVEWCKAECNKLVIYSRMPYDNVCSKFPCACDISILDKPDDALDIYSYEINVIHTSFWNYISEYNYNIDIQDGISHMYFFNNEKYVASLEVVDYENYILIEEVDNQQNKLLLGREFALENIKLCFEGKADIDELLQEEIWKPLGKN